MFNLYDLNVGAQHTMYIPFLVILLYKKLSIENNTFFVIK